MTDAASRRAPAGLDLEAAERAVAGLVRRTPLLRDPELSRALGREVLVKAENLQETGSFKVRGAASRLGALSAEERARGVVACSSGNHGRAVAHVAARLGLAAEIYVPSWVDPVKLGGIRASGARAVLAGSTFDESEALARAAAAESGRTYVSAYDDPWVIAGQGTIARELVEQLGSAPAAVLVPLSGGGLVGGIAAAFAARGGAGDGAEPQVVAVSAERAAVMLSSVRAGRPVDLPEEETLASALSGGIGLDNRHSFALVRDLVSLHATVTEAQIGEAMRHAARVLRVVVEGGGAVALAALLAGAWEPPASLADGPVVAVASGGNVSADTLARVLAGAAVSPD